MLYVAIMYVCLAAQCTFVTTEPAHYSSEAACEQAILESKDELRILAPGVKVQGACVPLDLKVV